MHTDAHDLEHASIMDYADPEVDIGGWGNPVNNHLVETGAFAGWSVEYPIRHQIRRRFLLYPFVNYTTDYHVIPERIGNVTITPGAIKDLIAGYTGDYTGFQKDIEAYQVCPDRLYCYCCSSKSVSKGSHFALHKMMGGDMGDEPVASGATSNGKSPISRAGISF